MYPDGLMPVQGTSLSTSGAGSRPWRTLLLPAAAVFVLFLLGSRLMAPGPSRTTVYTYQCSYLYSVSGQTIIELCRAGKADEAVLVADQDLRRLSGNPIAEGQIHFLRGGALRLLGREDDARADYAEAFDLAGPALSRDARMEFLAQSGDWSGVNRLAQQSIQQNPSDSFALNNACWEMTIYPGGNPDQAAQLMAPVAADSHNSAWIDTYAWSLYLSNHKDQAAMEEARAVQYMQGEDSDHISYYLACMEGMQGNRAVAEQELRQVFQNNIMFTSAWSAAERFAQK